MKVIVSEGMGIIDLLIMSELFFDGYSEYELEAMKIPSESRGKCLKQLVNFTLCHQKAGVARVMFSKACEDERARFDRCHIKSLKYYTGEAVGTMMFANPSEFQAQNVSPTYETFFPSPTPLNYTR